MKMTFPDSSAIRMEHTRFFHHISVLMFYLSFFKKTFDVKCSQLSVWKIFTVILENNSNRVFQFPRTTNPPRKAKRRLRMLTAYICNSDSIQTSPSIQSKYDKWHTFLQINGLNCPGNAFLRDSHFL